MARRRLHNAVQELKGNIRVYCRIRPVRPARPASDAGARAGPRQRAEGAAGMAEAV